MDLKLIHDLIRFFLQKEQSGWFSPEELDNLLDQAQWVLFNQLKPNYAKDQYARDALSIFSTPFIYTSTAAGLVQLPVNPSVSPCYEHLLSIFTQYWDNNQGRIRTNEIHVYNEDELARRLDSQILAPSITQPIGYEPRPGQVQLFPETEISGKGFYLRRPIKPVFAYTQSGLTIAYNQAGSTQLEWQRSQINKIIILTLQMAGVNVSEQMIIEWSEAKLQTQP